MVTGDDLTKTSVWIMSFHREWAEAAPDNLQRMFGVSAEVAQSIVKSAPMVVKRNATAEVAESYRRALEAIGAIVELRASASGLGKERRRAAPLTAAPPSSIPLPDIHSDAGADVSVWLTGFEEHQKHDAAESLRNVFSIELAVARRLLASVPVSIKDRVPLSQGERYQARLSAIGGIVELRPLEARSTNDQSQQLSSSVVRLPDVTPIVAAAEAPEAETISVTHPRRESEGEEPRQQQVRRNRGEHCVEHRDRSADFYCPECSFPWCGACVEHRWETVVYRDRCRRCGEVVDRLEVKRSLDTVGAYLAELPRMLMFPAHRGTALVLVGLAALTTPLSWAIAKNFSPALAALGWIIVAGLEASVYFHLVRQVAFGAEEIEAPDFVDFYSDIVGPLLHYCVALLPIGLAFVWAAFAGDGGFSSLSSMTSEAITEMTGPGIALVCGVLLLPLMTLIAAMSAAWTDILNPVEWFRALRVVGPKYVVGAGLFYALLAAEELLLEPLVNEFAALPVAGRFVALMLGYVVMSIRARALGSLVVGKV